MDPLKKLLALGLELAPLGLEVRSDNDPYFCTPRGASIFAWAGADGIHYCTIRGFGPMIFAVSPMNGPGEWVHPIAKDGRELLRLLLACGDAALLEQAWQWDRRQFSSHLRQHPPSAEQQALLDRLQALSGLTPAEDPFGTLSALQKSFDRKRLRYTEDVLDPDMNPNAPFPPWAVFFSGGFWGRGGGERPGSVLPLARRFRWAEREWQVPAVYLCGKGLVLDLCMEVSREELWYFSARWGLTPENDDLSRFSAEDQLRIQAENPLSFAVSPALTLNGRPLRRSRSWSLCWNPLFSGNAPESRQILEHYGLSPENGWVFWRFSFPWATARRPALKRLTLQLAQTPHALPGPVFSADFPGQKIVLTHPEGTEYTLTVQELTRESLPETAFVDAAPDDPRQYARLTYTLSPALERNAPRICAAFPGDPPRRKTPAAPFPFVPEFVPEAENAACICLIGGADGPTALVLRQTESALQTACSPLCFQLPEQLLWRAVFTLSPPPPAEFPLL